MPGIGNIISPKLGSQRGCYGYCVPIRQPMRSYKPANENTCNKKQVPDFFFPVVFKKRDVGRNTGGTNMSQVCRYPKMFIAYSNKVGTISPISGPAIYQGQGFRINSIILFIKLAK